MSDEEISGLLGKDTRRQLLGAHFEREEADLSAIDGLAVPVGRDVAASTMRATWKAMLVASERLAHGRTGRDDDEVGALQAAHQPVEIGEAGGRARQRAVALIGLAGHLDGFASAPR